MTEAEEMRKYAEAHGCGYRTIPVREIPGGGMISKRVYEPVRPLPCVRDEHGEIENQRLKALFSKINEELDELKEVILVNNCLNGKTGCYSHGTELETRIAEEAADTITAITTMLEAFGIDAEMRDEAIRLVNAKNRERGRL